MKWTKKKIVFTVFEIIFVAIVPSALVIVNNLSWGDGITPFKIYLGAILLLLLVYYIVKKTILNKYIERLKAMSAQHLADLKVEVDAEKKKRIREELRRERTIESLLSFVIPLLLLALFFVVCKTLESSMVKLSGTVGIIGASEIIGAVFSVLADREV